MAQITVAVQGLRDLNSALRRLDKDAPKALRLALNGVADILIGEVKPQIPRRTGRAAASIKAASSRTEVRIRVGGTKAPYYPWLDFGGRVGKNKSVTRRFYREGRYLFPTLRKERAKLEGALRRSLATVASDAGLDVD
jgi:hypothetical protein